MYRPNDYPQEPQVTIIGGMMMNRGLTIQEAPLGFVCTSFLFLGTSDKTQAGAPNTQRVGRAFGRLRSCFEEDPPVLLGTKDIMTDARANERSLHNLRTQRSDGTFYLRSLISDEEYRTLVDDSQRLVQRAPVVVVMRHVGVATERAATNTAPSPVESQENREEATNTPVDRTETLPIRWRHRVIPLDPVTHLDTSIPFLTAPPEPYRVAVPLRPEDDKDYRLIARRFFGLRTLQIAYNDRRKREFLDNAIYLDPDRKNYHCHGFIFPSGSARQAHLVRINMEVRAAILQSYTPAYVHMSDDRIGRVEFYSEVQGS
jgi:hypothetical protein